MAQGDCTLVQGLALVVAGGVAALLVVLAIEYWHPTAPRYYASILSVSGLGVDDDEWGRQPLQFNLTLGVQCGCGSMFWRRRACIERGTAVQVAYHGVTLMYGTTSGWGELCAVPRQYGTVRVLVFKMSRNNVTGLPEDVVEGLVADARRAFDVTAWIPSTGEDGDHGKKLSCMARVVGDNSFFRACDVDYP